MVTLRPFVGHVVAAGHAAEVVAPPYDLLTDDQRAAFASDRPDSFLNVLPSGGADGADLRANRRALERLMDGDRFVPTPGPVLSVLCLAHARGRTVAVVGDVEVAAFVDGRVLPHEHVRPDRVAQLARHLEVVRMASSPVCVVHRPNAQLDALTDRILRTSVPDVRFRADDGVLVTLHLVTEPGTRDQLTSAVAETGQLYVADGHHRAAAVAHDATPTTQVLTAVVPSDHLRVMAFHRRIDGLGEATPSGVLAELERADLLPEPLAIGPEGPSSPDEPGIVHVTIDGHWWAIDLRDRRAGGPVESLDVRLVERELLEPLGRLGADPTRPGGVEVVAVPAPLGLAALVAPGSVGVALHPPTIDDVLAVADTGAVMPAKSTYLAPKLRSGLIVVPR